MRVYIAGMTGRWLAAIVFLMTGCREVGLKEDIHVLRKDIGALEKKVKPETPIYVDDFGSALDDETASVPFEIYEHVVRHLARMSDDDVRAKVAKSVDFDQLVDDSNKTRGNFVRMEGVIGRIWKERVDIPGLPEPWVYAGIVFVKNRDPLLFHVIERPDLLYLKQDMVYLDAIFLKVIEYELQGGGTVRAPLVVGRRLHKYH